MGLEELILDTVTKGVRSEFINGVLILCAILICIAMIVVFIVTRESIMSIMYVYFTLVIGMLVALCLLLLLVKPVTNDVINSSISITSEVVEYEVEALPNEVINFKTDTVLIDGRRQNLIMLKDTVYTDIEGQAKIKANKYNVRIKPEAKYSSLSKWLVTDEVVAKCDDILEYLECVELYY